MIKDNFPGKRSNSTSYRGISAMRNVAGISRVYPESLQRPRSLADLYLKQLLAKCSAWRIPGLREKVAS